MELSCGLPPRPRLRRPGGAGRGPRLCPGVDLRIGTAVGGPVRPSGARRRSHRAHRAHRARHGGARPDGAVGHVHGVGRGHHRPVERRALPGLLRHRLHGPDDNRAEADAVGPPVRPPRSHGALARSRRRPAGGRADLAQRARPTGPEGERHLLTFEGHVTHLPDRDVGLLDHIDVDTMVGDPPTIAREVEGVAAAGFAEAIYTPAGPDVGRELRSFLAACRSG